ncbi:MAG TPA: hypothetical protein VGJ84_09010, partial [Polyangiaceae bacterium]
AAPPKSGVCAFQENGYDNQDTRSEEKLVVKINEDRIVHASYHYKGSYQLEGVGDMSVPIKDGKWVSFEIPMASGGVGKYQVKLDGDMMLFKGTANDRPHGQCRWEKPEGK